MTELHDDIIYEVLLEKNVDLANEIGVNFGIGSNSLPIIQNVDRNLNILSIFPEHVHTIQNGDVILGINFCNMTSIDANGALNTLQQELNNKSETFVKLKLRRSSESHFDQNVFVFNFKGLSGETVQLEVVRNDNIEEVVKKFVVAHNLPNEIILPLLNRISKEMHQQDLAKNIEYDEFPADNTFQMNELHNSLHYNSLRQSALSQLVQVPNKHSRGTGKRSPSKSPLKNQSCDRMHDQAQRIRERKESLKIMVEKEREDKIKESSFRFQQSKSPLKKSSSTSFLINSRDRPEQIYYDHMIWVENREQNLERIRKELKQKEDEEIAREMQDIPKLHTSPYMQRYKSPSKEQLHNSMFLWDHHYQSRKEDLINREMRRLETEAYFVPKINKRSEKLANQRLHRLKMSGSPTRANIGDSNVSPVAHQWGCTSSRDYQQQSSPLEYTFFADALNTSGIESVNEDVETAKVYMEAETRMLSLNLRSSNDPTILINHDSNVGHPIVGDQNMVMDEIVINELREAKIRPLFSPNSKGDKTLPLEDKNSMEWIQTLCERKRELLQQKLPGIIGHCDMMEMDHSVASGSKPFDKKFRSVSPLTSCTHYSDSVTTPTGNYRKFSYGPSQTPSISTIAQSLSPCRNSHNYRSKLDLQFFPPDENFDVFSRLYKQREDHQSLMQSLKQKYIPQFAHSPNIGSNHYHSTESKRDDFFQRLFEHHEKQQEELMVAQENQHQEILNLSNKLMMDKSVLSLEENENLVKRLYWKQQKTEEFRKNFKEKIFSDLQKSSTAKHIEGNSNKIANKQLHDALSEIFDVLKLSEEYELERRKSDKFSSEAKVDSEQNLYSESKTNCDDCRFINNPEKDLLNFDEVATANDIISGYPLLDLWETEEKKSDSGVEVVPQVHPTTKIVAVPNNNPVSTKELNINFANSTLLKPKLLAENIQLSLNVFSSRKQYFISKADFIGQVLQMMFDGQLTPIAYLLTSQRERKFRKKVKTSEEMELELHCTHHPTLKADKTTTNLTEQRYSDRNNKQISIEDSLLSYIPIVNQNKEMIRQQVEDDIHGECTFRPFLVATHLKGKPKATQKRSISAPSARRTSEIFVDGSLNNLLDKPVEAWYEI